MLPWFVFRLPHERTGGVTNTIGDEQNGVHGDSFSVSSGDIRKPRK